MLVLSYNDGSGEVRNLTFSKSSLMIGRAQGNDVCLEHVKGVSRYHARLYVEADKVIIQDLNSTNGTFVNTVKVETSAVTARDTIIVGDASIRVVHEEGAASEEPTLSTNDKEAKGADGKTITDDIHVQLGLPAPLSASGDALSATGTNLHNDFYWTSLSNYLNPIWPYVLDESVREIMINGPREIYIEAGGKIVRSETTFTEAELKAALLNITQYAGRKLNDQDAYLEARLPDGSRVTVVLPPFATKGMSITIRKFSKDALTLDRWVGFGSLTQEMLTFLKACVVLKKNVLIAGGSGSGKTSLLNVLCGFISAEERVISVEDCAELQLTNGHVVSLEASPRERKPSAPVGVEDLCKIALRMRPDRLVLGEVRGREVLDLLLAMSSGQPGSMTTVCAMSPFQALHRIENMAFTANNDIHAQALRRMVAGSVDIVVQTSRFPDYSRKVTQISEVQRFGESGDYELIDIYRFVRTLGNGDRIQGAHVRTGTTPKVADEIRVNGFEDAASLF